MERIWVRVVGHGIVVVPSEVGTLTCVEGRENEILVENRKGRAIVDAFEPSRPQPFARVSAGEELGSWQVETSAFCVPWPPGFRVVVDPEPPGFHFDAEDGSRIDFAGPLDATKLGPIEQLVAPGRELRFREVDDDRAWGIAGSRVPAADAYLEALFLVPLVPGRTMFVRFGCDDPRFSELLPTVRTLAASVAPGHRLAAG